MVDASTSYLICWCQLMHLWLVIHFQICVFLVSHVCPTVMHLWSMSVLSFSKLSRALLHIYDTPMFKLHIQAWMPLLHMQVLDLRMVNVVLSSLWRMKISVLHLSDQPMPMKHLFKWSRLVLHISDTTLADQNLFKWSMTGITVWCCCR